MSNVLKQENMNEERLSDENMRHKKVVKEVYEKWLGAGNEVRCNEGIAVKASLSAFSSMEDLPQKVSPKGKVFDVPRTALSDRPSKYMEKGQNKGPEGKKMGVSKKSLSDR